MEIRASNILCIIPISLLLLAGCETSFDFQLNAVPKLTIISHLAPNSVPDNWESQRVYVYATQSPSDTSNFFTPDDLVVDVTEEETKITVRLDTTAQGGKIYFEFPEGFLKAGFTYSITAFAPGFDIVQATTYIPKPSTISDLRIQDINIEQSAAHDFKKILRYKVVFNIDHFEGNRYYHLIFYNQYEGILNKYHIIDPKPSDDQPFLQHYEYGVLIDKDELDINQPLTFEFQDWVIDNHNLIKVHVELRTITEAYYKYHSSLARQLIVRQDPFAEPVSIFNNIEGGYGNFSGFSPNIYTSDLPQ